MRIAFDLSTLFNECRFFMKLAKRQVCHIQILTQYVVLVRFVWTVRLLNLKVVSVVKHK